MTRTCKDGALGPVEEGQYDLDQQANGACTFGFFCLEVCGSLVESVVVPVGQSRLVERGNLSGITVKPPRLPQRQSSPPKMFGRQLTMPPFGCR